MRLPAGAIYHRHAVRSPRTPGTGSTDENPVVHVLRRPPEDLLLGRPRTVVEGAGPGRPSVMIDVIRQFHDGMRARVRMDDGELLGMVRRHTGTPARMCAVTIAVQHILCSGDRGGTTNVSAKTTPFSITWYFSTKKMGADRTRHCWIGCGGQYGECYMPTMLGSCPDRQQG